MTDALEIEEYEDEWYGYFLSVRKGRTGDDVVDVVLFFNPTQDRWPKDESQRQLEVLSIAKRRIEIAIGKSRTWHERESADDGRAGCRRAIRAE